MTDEELFAGFTPKQVRHFKWLQRKGPAEWILYLGRMLAGLGIVLFLLDLLTGHFSWAGNSGAIVAFFFGMVNVTEYRHQQVVRQLIKNVEAMPARPAENTSGAKDK